MPTTKELNNNKYKRIGCRYNIPRICIMGKRVDYIQGSSVMSSDIIQYVNK